MMQLFYRSFLSLLAFTCLLLGLANLVQVRTTRGMALRALKSVFQTLAPFLAAAGLASAVLAMQAHAPLAILAGSLGALLSIAYILQVSRPHQAFSAAFGQSWQNQVQHKRTAEQRSHMLSRRWAWRMPPTGCDPCWQRDIVYRSLPACGEQPEIPLLCDLWQPPPGIKNTGVALVYVHGGGYYNGCKDFGTRSFFRHLAAQGHVIMDIEYRLAPRVGLFEMVDDVRHAVLWMKTNAAQFGVDPGRVVLIGGSAGGQLAMLAAYGWRSDCFPALPDGADASVRAVVSYYGVTDMVAAYRKVQNLFAKAPKWRAIPQSLIDRPLAGQAIILAARFREVEPAKMRSSLLMDQVQLVRGPEAAMRAVLGGTPNEQPNMYRLASPINFAGPDSPATLLFQGTHDYLLPVEPTRALYHKLRNAGVPAVYVEIPQTEHTFDLFLPRFSPPALAALYDLDRFLALVE